MFISSNSPSKICIPLSKLASESSPMKNSNAFHQRLAFQKKNIQNQRFDDFSLSQNQNDLMEFKGFITGPDNTPYEGGKFYISIRISSEYPFKAPKVKFETKIYHPNVSKTTGYLNCKFLTNSWSPMISLIKLLQETIKLLKSPDLEGCYETQIAHIFQKDLKTFKSMAKSQTQKYAK